MVPVFKNVEERSTAENYRPVSLLSVVSKVFESLVSLGLFSDLQYCLRSSWLTEDLLTVVSDRIAKTFNRSRASRAVAVGVYKAFDRVWNACIFYRLEYFGIWGHIFGLTSSFLSNKQLRVVLNGKSSQEYSVNAGVPQSSILGPRLFLLYIHDLVDDVIRNIAIYAFDITLYSKCDQKSDLWQQPELASVLWDTEIWGGKSLVDCNAGKITFKMLWLTLSSKFD